MSDVGDRELKKPIAQSNVYIHGTMTVSVVGLGIVAGLSAEEKRYNYENRTDKGKLR